MFFQAFFVRVALAFRRPKKIRKYVSIFLGSILLIFGAWTMEFAFFDLKIGCYVKFPPWGQVLRSQFWSGGQKMPPPKKDAERLAK